ncbi:hypothetical protein SAY86_004217 [Trapa natans]|uniref:Subtilisin-like protease n=1 Tax=Trapa natans TaxID=22666 RepID=A0AAN7MYC8_TRANT|nr:hypothetical protein SAY86_004217 [Trapa natans]
MMGLLSGSSHLGALMVLLFCVLQKTAPASALKKPYIVYLGSHSHGLSPTEADANRATNAHYSLLGSLLGSEEAARDSMFYSYNRYINGFAAVLEEDQAKLVSEHPAVISVFPSRGRKLHTTRSWEFMNLERDGRVPRQSIWTKARFGEDVIIANIDTGVWPESESFNDNGLGPVPKRWRGICQNSTTDRIVCNRKLIGVRYFNKGYAAFFGEKLAFKSGRDTEGHGTHTLSTAGGSFVVGANVFGFGNGTAKGGSPRARVAAYKACGPPINGQECFDSDILAAYEAAISDGVDVISMSLGGSPFPLFEDPLAIASFHATKSGITVVASGGNSGPAPGTVSNICPWMITVAASTIDREFSTYVSIGFNKHFKGASLSTKALPKKKFYPIIRSGKAKMANVSESEADVCLPGSLDPKKVKGKIVVCLRGENDRVDKGITAASAGAVGMVLTNDPMNENDIIADPHVLPTSHITYDDGQALFAYMSSTKSPMAYITRAKTVLGAKPSPYVTAFSSRGPNTIDQGILKPDITAPGAGILAAYTGEVSDNRPATPFVFMSGTSMSCPHISGVVGLLKSLYPGWSPAAIRSAIMTTAKSRDNKNEPILDSSFNKATPFDYGSGHVQPNRAMDPGLVYDITAEDYLDFLCAEGYNSSMLKVFTNETYTCPKGARVANLNYPSITVPGLGSKGAVVYRKLKNVGHPGTYRVRVKAPSGVTVTVVPAELKFAKVGEEKSFKVIFKAERKSKKPLADYLFGHLVWSDGKHYVRSPISVLHV